MMTLVSTMMSLVETTTHKSNFSAAILNPLWVQWHYDVIMMSLHIIMMSLWCHNCSAVAAAKLWTLSNW